MGAPVRQRIPQALQKRRLLIRRPHNKMKTPQTAPTRLTQGARTSPPKLATSRKTDLLLRRMDCQLLRRLPRRSTVKRL
ncbi:unnamed protein product [Dibothriocephalus latus]|uniref:Uncharacterized protein n=1 Tax=Dibothriocephalus latus TaxID=60516 RepID=A0A3P6S2Q2_DIBLA|nr:unnamed protein product [Dibothriocephalus latus]